MIQIILAILLFASTSFAAGPAMMVGGGTGAAVTYYGYVGAGGTDDVLSGYEVHNAARVVTVVTGGAVVELSGYFKTTGAAGNILLALYSADRSTKICEGSAQVSVSSASYSWVGHTTGGLTGTCTVSSSTNYTLSATADGTDVNLDYISGKTAGDDKYIASDYTAGYPSTLGDGSNTTGWFKIRVGVQ